jgi:hypothetical protein
MYKDLDSDLIAAAAADTGNFVDAKAIAATIEDSHTKALTYDWIAHTQAKSGDVAGAEATAALISEKDATPLAHGAIVTAKARTGKVAEAIEYSNRMTDDPSTRCSWIAEAAKELSSAPEKAKAVGK